MSFPQYPETQRACSSLRTVPPASAVKAMGMVRRAVETTEMGCQTGGGSGGSTVSVCLQAGVGRLLTREELEDTCNVIQMRVSFF